MAGTSPSQLQDIALVLTEFHKVAVGLFLQTSEVLLDSSPALEHIGSLTWRHLQTS